MGTSVAAIRTKQLSMAVTPQEIAHGFDQCLLGNAAFLLKVGLELTNVVIQTFELLVQVVVHMLTSF